MAEMDREEIIVEAARLMWRKGLSISEFYEAMGIDLDDLDKSDPTDVVSLLAGVFTGWNNPPETAPAKKPEGAKAQAFAVPADAA